MERGLAVIVLAALSGGCFALQRTPDLTVLHSLRTIAIIPLEAPTPQYHFRPRGLRVPVAPGPGALVLAPIVIPVAIFLAADHIQRTAAIPETPLTAVAGSPTDGVQRTTAMSETPVGAVAGRTKDSGALTTELAREAVAILQRFNMTVTAFLADGYLQLPLIDTARPPDQVQFETDTRIRRWYNEDTANVNYSGLSTEGVDAILEVGISDYWYTDIGLVLQVHARLVNPETKAVLGRARNEYPPLSSRLLGPPMRGKPPGTPEQRDNPAVTIGRQLMLDCLKDLGLIRDSE